MRQQTGLGRLISESGDGARPGAFGQSPGQLGREAIDRLAEVPLFSSLSRRHLGKVAGVATAKRYAAHSLLVRVGMPADAFYVILEGRARVDIPGRHVYLEAGDFFGEMALIDGEPRSASVVAESEVYAMKIPRAKFLKLLDSEPKIALGIMTTLVGRIRDIQAAAAL